MFNVFLGELSWILNYGRENGIHTRICRGGETTQQQIVASLQIKCGKYVKTLSGHIYGLARNRDIQPYDK